MFRTKQKISFKTINGFFLVDPSSIDYIKSEDVYAFLFNDGEKLFVKDSLKTMETCLKQDRFFRCHRSFIVNLDKVKKVIKRPNLILEMTCGAKVPVSRKLKSKVLEKLFINPA